MKVKHLFLLLYFIIGCSSSIEDNLIDIKPSVQKFSIWVDQYFSNEENKQIELAISEWNKTFNGLADIKVVDWNFEFKNIYDYNLDRDYDFAIIKLNSNHPSLSKSERECLAFVNTKYYNRNITILSDKVPIDNLKAIIIHEFGHCIKIDHNFHGTMNPFYSSEEYKCVDFWTVSQVEKVWNFKPGIMIPCP